MTSYNIIYDKCLARINDPTIAMLPDEEIEKMLYGWMLSAIAKHRKCTNDLGDRNEELKCFNANLTDLEQEILSIMMAREWVLGQLTSVTLTLQAFSGKETSFFSQSAHMKELSALDDKLRLEAQQLSRDYTYMNNSYFD